MRKKPSRCLTPKHCIKGCIHRAQKQGFPPAPSFPAPKSHQTGLKQFKQGTEVTKRTATDAIGSIRFNLNGFTYYFTFFSKFFSSFPHGTCSLSVSGKYLALEGYYLPLCAAVPSNTTLRMRTVTGVSRHGTRLLRSSEGCLNNHLRASATCRYAPLDHNSHGTRPGIFGLSCSRFTRRYWGNPC